MKKFTAAVRGSVLVAGILAIGCANEVIIPGETNAVPSSDPSGAGGAGGGDSTGAVTSVPDDCTPGCDEPSDSTTCSCSITCGGSTEIKISCAPTIDLQGHLKNQCVCNVKDQFSGICFETDPGAMCSFDMGCCAKYFSGK
jgi:hypothetical protein